MDAQRRRPQVCRLADGPGDRAGQVCQLDRTAGAWHQQPARRFRIRAVQLMKTLTAIPQSLAALAKSEAWDDSTHRARLAEFRGFAERLAKVARDAGKWLTLVAEQAPAEVEHEALMPRLHEACGLDPEEMDRCLHELRDADLIRIDGQYPFEQIAAVAEPSGWVPMNSLAKLAKANGVNLREALSEMDWMFVEQP